MGFWLCDFPVDTSRKFPLPDYPFNPSKYGSTPNIKVHPPKIKRYVCCQLERLILRMLENDAEERISIEEAREEFKTI